MNAARENTLVFYLQIDMDTRKRKAQFEVEGPDRYRPSQK
jgi:hypothetical protein